MKRPGKSQKPERELIQLNQKAGCSFASRFLFPQPPLERHVAQVALKHQVMLRHDRHDHHRKLRALGLVNRDHVCQGQLVDFDHVQRADEADVAVVDILVVIVERLHDLIASAEGVEAEFLRVTGVFRKLFPR